MQLASLDKRHDEIEAQLCLEAVLHAAEERMVGLEKDIPLSSCQFNHALLEYFVLTNSFDSKLLIRAVQSGQEDTTKAPSANLFHQVEVFERHFIHLLILAY